MSFIYLNAIDYNPLTAHTRRLPPRKFQYYLDYVIIQTTVQKIKIRLCDFGKHMYVAGTVQQAWRLNVRTYSDG